MLKTVLYMAVASVCAALAMMLFFNLRTIGGMKPPKPAGHMDRAIPMKSGKWTGRDMPLGPTEEVARASENILSVNEYLSRRYVSPDGGEFTLYISYWAEGKEPVSRASTHLPDNCWVEGGWTNLPDFKVNGRVIEAPGGKFFPGNTRKFEIRSNSGESVRREVIYWYVVDGKGYDYGGGDTRIPSAVRYVENMLRQGTEGIPEQYFIRIDSSAPIDSIISDPDVAPILEALGSLVLFDRSAGEGQAK